MLNSALFKRYLPFATSLLAVQGTIYLLQLLSAAQMTAHDYSSVRIIESSAAVGTLLITFGVPSVILVRLGTFGSPRERFIAGSGALANIGVSAIVCGVGYAVMLHYDLLLAEIKSNAVSVAALAAAMAVRLFLMSISQARERFLSLAMSTVTGSFAAIAALLIARNFEVPPVAAWIVSRFALESTICAALLVKELFPLARQSRFIHAAFDLRQGVVPVAVLAFPVGASLIIRALVEHGPIFWLASFGASPNVVAEAGIIITLGTIALVPGTVVQGVLIPRLARTINATKRQDYIGMIGLLIGVLGMTGVLFVCLLVGANMFLPLIRLESGWIYFLGALMVIAKMTAGALGGFLLVHQKGRTILALNAATLSLAAVIGLGLQNPIAEGLTITQILAIVAAIETSAAMLYVLVLAFQTFPGREPDTV